MTVCRVCHQEKEASDFYPKQIRRDGESGECKECTKERVRNNRDEKIDYYRNYDRVRYRENDHRKDAARRSSESAAGIASRKKYRDRIKGTPKRRAHCAVNNAVRDGRLTKDSECFFCGAEGKLHAHHHDYSRPLDVFWLCPPCHGKLHTVNGDFLRGEKRA